VEVLQPLRWSAVSFQADPRPNPATVSARGLEKRFGAVAALRGVDLDIPSRHLVAVLGPNGAGKSTLIKILAGLTRPTAGTLSIADAVGKSRYHARLQIGFVGHATLLYPELSARENLVFTGRLHGLADPRGRAEQLLEEEGLLAIGDRRARSLSRGLAQRLSIARALVHDPSLLLLDEPFTGLDRPSADRLAARLASLREKGRSLALVTHDLMQASELADSVILLVDGRPLYRAEREQVRHDDLEQTYRSLTGGLP